MLAAQIKPDYPQADTILHPSLPASKHPIVLRAQEWMVRDVRPVRWRIAGSSLDSNVYEAAFRPQGQFGVDRNVAGRLD